MSHKNSKENLLAQTILGKKKKTKGNENFEGSDNCLSTKLIRRKQLKEENLKRNVESFSS